MFKKKKKKTRYDLQVMLIILEIPKQYFRIRKSSLFSVNLSMRQVHITFRMVIISGTIEEKHRVAEDCSLSDQYVY